MIMLLRLGPGSGPGIRASIPGGPVPGAREARSDDDAIMLSAVPPSIVRILQRPVLSASMEHRLVENDPQSGRAVAGQPILPV
ncbi:hypothetical protein BL254_16610 [Protofrankia sp. BMG5.30]|uniref:Uncharacterized protein n=1 Tax=Protofrankia coriariae TaxID=1562887 RepID=A0ABR5F418_9ACTN|nr:hypothetical protein FrCorBMG51_11665 [Protofrankia coriariae]ONH34322.1 hypothetical protein BL254_16610 [Protofrankia sp. BMG5.30]